MTHPTASAAGAFYGWKLLAVLFLALSINAGFGLYGSAVMNSYMTTAVGLDRGTLGLIFSIYVLISGTSGPVVALCIRRFGVRATLTAGSLILCVGAAVMAAVVRNGLMAVLVFGVIMGCGAGLAGPVAAQTSVTRWFVRKRTLAVAIVLSTTGVGGFVAAPLANNVITAFGGDWRAGWWLFAILSAAATLALAWFVRERPEDLGQCPDGSSEAPGAALSSTRRVYVTTEAWTVGAVFRCTVWWLLLAAAIAIGAGMMFFLGHGLVHLRDLGYSPAAAAMSLSILTITQLAGTLGIGVLGDHLEPRMLWSICMAVFGVGFLVAVNASGTASLYACAVCIGAGFGGAITCMMTLPGNYFGARAYPALAGSIGAASTVMGSLTAAAAGYFYDAAGNYDAVFYAVAALSFLGALALLFARPPVLGLASLEVLAHRRRSSEG